MKKSKPSFALILVIIAIFSFTAIGFANTSFVIVDSPTLNIRSGPGLSYPVIGQLTEKDRVEIHGQEGDWLKIHFGQEEGWIANWLTTSEDAQAQSQSSTVVAQVNSLNIRSAPSIQSSVIGKMQAGTVATATGRTGEWISIVLDGQDGWVHADYVAETKEANKADETSVETPTISKTTADPDTFTVAVDKLIVRKSPTPRSKEVAQISKGETYEVKKKSGNWVQIGLDQKKKGWVYSFHGYLSATTAGQDDTAKQEDLGVVTILTDGTNLREQPSTTSGVVMRVNAGETFPIVSRHDDWFEITLPDNQKAFVAEWVVSASRTDSSSPAKQPKQAREKGTLKGLTIVLDPGHGGHDRGTTGARGTIEKELTLETAEQLAAKLQAAGAEVILTRDSDEYVTLSKRVSISQYNDADAFISIHYDAHIDSSIAGFTTYFTHANQQPLAEAVNEGLAGTLTLRNRGFQHGDYHVLRENDSHGILVELGYLSNYSEERIVTTDQFREQATHGIYQGLLDYFNE